MRKVFAFTLCLMLTFVCCSTAFAADGTATLDEAYAYDFVSYTNPTKLYYSKGDLEQINDDGIMGFRPNFSGMTVTFYNPYLGKTSIAYGDNGDIGSNKVWFENPDEKNQIKTVYAVVFYDIDDNHKGSYPLNFQIYYNFDEKTTTDERSTNPIPPAKENINSSTNDTAVDTSVKTTDNKTASTTDTAVDNNTIQTGSFSISVASLALVIIASATVVVYFYKKRLPL